MEFWVRKPLRDNRFGLIPRLWVVWELTIMHRDACNLSSLKVRGILVISQDRVSYIRKLMETIRNDALFETK